MISVSGNPTSLDEAVTDEEVSEEPENETPAAEDEDLCDVPRSDSAATVALDIDDRQNLDPEPEFVNLVSPEKPYTLSEDTTLPSDILKSFINAPLKPLLDGEEEEQSNENQTTNPGIQWYRMNM